MAVNLFICFKVKQVFILKSPNISINIGENSYQYLRKFLRSPIVLIQKVKIIRHKNSLQNRGFFWAGSVSIFGQMW